jgi:hypothetical protein
MTFRVPLPCLLAMIDLDSQLSDFHVTDPHTMPMQNRYGFNGGHNGPSTSHDYTLPPNNNGMSQMTAHGIDLVPTTRLRG